MAYANQNPNVIGVPGLLWLTLRDMSLNPGKLQKALDQTDWIYDYTAGLIATKKDDKEIVKQWEAKLQEILNELEQAEQDYNPLFEDESLSDEEAKYRRQLKNVRRKILFLIIDAKLVDREYQRVQEAPNPIGDD